jgi:hypothetical protein
VRKIQPEKILLFEELEGRLPSCTAKDGITLYFSSSLKSYFPSIKREYLVSADLDICRNYVPKVVVV